MNTRNHLRRLISVLNPNRNNCLPRELQSAGSDYFVTISNLIAKVGAAFGGDCALLVTPCPELDSGKVRACPFKGAGTFEIVS